MSPTVRIKKSKDLVVLYASTKPLNPVNPVNTSYCSHLKLAVLTLCTLLWKINLVTLILHATIITCVENI